MGQILSAQTTILSEGFEGTFPGIWLVGDDNAAGTPAYWKDVNASFGGEATHSGSWKGYCAGFGYAGDAANPTYQNSMAAYMQTTLDLRGYVSATLKFWSKIPSIESCCDGARVFIDGILVWFSSSPQAAWGEETFDLTSYVGGVHTLRFEFDSDGSGTYKGWYLDDISVTGIPAPSNDECAGAITLLPDVPFVMSTVEATSVNDPAPTCQPNFGKGVWFTYRPSSSGKMIVSTCGSSFDTVLQVYHGTCRVLTPVAGGCVEDNGPACSGSAASVAFDGVAGVMYFILAGGYNGQSGTLQIIAARDLTPPVIACPPTIVTNTAPGQCAQVIRFNVTATDNFDPNPTVTCSPASGSTFPRGTTTVYCTATDFSSNSSSCSFVVTVVDAEPPQVICSANIVADADPGQSSKSNVTFTATATDNCPGVTVACNPPSGSTFPVGVTRVTCTAVDASTNLSSCSFTVTVNRDLSPKPITIATVPSGLQVSVDGVTYPAPQVFNWTPGSQHTVSATSPQAGAAGTQYV